MKAYVAADTRLLLLDYDGVLAPITQRPEQSAPSNEVRSLIRKLSEQGAKIVIISGRDRETLEQWLGDLPIDLSAEHGHFRRESLAWRTSVEFDMSWRDDVYAEMKRLTAEYPGSHIETKHASLVWHYRQVMQPVDERAVRARIDRIADGRAEVMPGKFVIDVRAPGTDKGEAARHWYETASWDFAMCIGDDVTDEAMFAVLPASAWTIKVGDGSTKARFTFADQGDVVSLLKDLTAL